MPGEDVTVTANFAVIPMVAAGGYHTVGLVSDGIVVAVGRNNEGQCDVGDWTLNLSFPLLPLVRRRYG